MELEICIKQRRDTRHFLPGKVPDEVVSKALTAAHHAPSVGMSEPWRFVIVESLSIRQKIKRSYAEARAAAEKNIGDESRLHLHKNLKLEAIEDAPLGIAVFCEKARAEDYTIGVIGSEENFTWSCACAVQNLWLSLTDQGYSAGWVSILDYNDMNEILDVPRHWKFLGYLCIGQAASDYDGKPMLEKEGWKARSSSPIVLLR